MTDIQRIHALLRNLLGLFDEARVKRGWPEEFRHALLVPDASSQREGGRSGSGAMGSLNKLVFHSEDGQCGAGSRMKAWHAHTKNDLEGPSTLFQKRRQSASLADWEEPN